VEVYALDSAKRSAAKPNVSNKLQAASSDHRLFSSAVLMAGLPSRKLANTVANTTRRDNVGKRLRTTTAFLAKLARDGNFIVCRFITEYER